MKTTIQIFLGIMVMISAVSFAQHEHHQTPQTQPTEQQEGHQPEMEKPAPAQDKIRFESGMTLQQLEEVALKNNPTIVQAEAAIRGARGRLSQAGLFPNPTVGYTAEELAFRAPREMSEHMFFVEQDIPLGRKLSKRKNVFQAELAQSEVLSQAQRTILLNAVRSMYYQVLGAQYQVVVRKRLADLAQEAVQTTSELFNVGAADRPDHLEAEIEAQASQLAFQEAQNELQHKIKALASIVGDSEMQIQSVAGVLDFSNLPNLDRQSLLENVIKQSPQVRTAQLQLKRAESAVTFAKSGRIPDLSFRGGVGYNYETFELTNESVGWEGFFEVGITLPIFNRNQGNTALAQADVERARSEITRVRLALESNFADVFASYANQRLKAEKFEKDMLPRAREAYQLYLTSFQQMAAAYPQVLISQRNLYQLEVEYIETLTRASNLAVQLHGMLLGAEGLGPPAFSISNGESNMPETDFEILDLPGHELD